MSTAGYTLDWADLAFGSKKPLRELHATIIVAPREISDARFRQLIATYLPKGNLVLGIAKEPYIDGFKGQPQFRTLQLDDVASTIAKVNASGKAKYRIYTLAYNQRDLPYILEKIPFQRTVLVNGSWKQTFHTLPAYYVLAAQGTPIDMVSPFASEQEARSYETRVLSEITAQHTFAVKNYSAEDMLALAGEAAQFSFDYSHQTGVTLGKLQPGGKTFKLVSWAYNRIVPFQTYAMHYGASRETHFSPPHDLNHYDTVHAEVELLVRAQKEHIDLHGTTLFINLLPCPSCARMFTETDIGNFVYSVDHSEGYAVKMLEAAGKTVRRIVL
nr:Cytidine and deoxycytidylate deaminase zinc-binding region [uncultured bacterium]